MRTMLILILHIWSLAQLADSALFHPEQCGGIYKCVVPEICTDGALKTVENYNVKEVGKTDKITDDCPALLRYHPYYTNWARVSIESFSDDITAIVFKQTSPLNVVKAEFSCKTNGGNVEGKYKRSMKYLNENPAGKLKCAFDVRLQKKTDVLFFAFQTDTLQFELSYRTGVNKATKNEESYVPIDTQSGCDPSRLKSSIENIKPDRLKVYAKIQIEPGSFGCKDPTVFKKEFRDVGYNIVKKLECIGSKFKIDGLPIITPTIDIRCVAEAHFFCQYDVKGKAGETAPTATKSDWKHANPSPSTLECPPDKPHLIVNNKVILNANSKIKCLNYGSSRFWTVENEGQSFPLTAEGPEVYCTKEVECHHKYIIPESSVHGGRLGGDRLPECLPTGTMKVNDELVTGKVNCDLITGDYEYPTSAGPKAVNPDTIFECKYEKNDKDAIEANQKNKEIIRNGAFIVAGATGALVLVIIAVSFACAHWRFRRHEREAAAAENAAFLRLCMTPDEKEEYRLEHNLPSEDDDDKVDIAEPKWNKMMMAAQYRAVVALATIKGGGFLTSVDKIEPKAPEESEEPISSGAGHQTKGVACRSFTVVESELLVRELAEYVKFLELLAKERKAAAEKREAEEEEAEAKKMQ